MQLTNRQIFFKHLALPSDVPDALEVVKAEGIYLYTDKGEKYIDLVSGVSVSNLGHSHPEVVEAVQKQAATYMHLMVYGKYIQSPQVRLAGEIVKYLPPALNSVYLVNSGSEAIEGALKLAKRITGRRETVAFKNAYHGSTHGALSILGNEEMKNAFRPLLPGIRFLEFNNTGDLEQISVNTACVVIEPVQAEAGIIIPGKEYMTALRKKCDETGALLIFDEVQMGFGRTGKLFAFENYGIVPDILCLAKAMGGGMPIGAFISSKENMHLLTHHPALGHITTFGGHPVSSAAALASLKIIVRDKLYEKAGEKGKLFVKYLKNHKLVKEIRQTGLMIGVELINGNVADRLVSKLFENKMVVDRFLFNRNSFRIAPPLNITNEEIEMISELIVKSLNEVAGTN
jgi:acetylornithine/succinyldiaminopimelate/putrescine aminotransferase